MGRAVAGVGTWVVAQWRAAPLTLCYLATLLLAHLWLTRIAADPGAVVRAVSTNQLNMHSRPISALFGSLLFFNGPLTPAASQAFAGTLITVGIGIGGALAWLERRRGIVWAYGSFLAGHILATLLTLVVIRSATDAGRYPASMLGGSDYLDYGVSYGAETALAMITFALPRRARALWILLVLGWPIVGATWYGYLPDFTTVGHLISATIGFIAGAVAFRDTSTVAVMPREGQPPPTPEPGAARREQRD